MKPRSVLGPSALKQTICISPVEQILLPFFTTQTLKGVRVLSEALDYALLLGSRQPAYPK